jgi:hypothetical protein
LAVILRISIVKCVAKLECYSDRLIFVKISAKPVCIVIVKVFKSTTDPDDDEILVEK